MPSIGPALSIKLIRSLKAAWTGISEVVSRDVQNLKPIVKKPNLYPALICFTNIFHLNFTVRIIDLFSTFVR